MRPAGLLREAGLTQVPPRLLCLLDRPCTRTVHGRFSSQTRPPLSQALASRSPSTRDPAPLPNNLLPRPLTCPSRLPWPPVLNRVTFTLRMPPSRPLCAHATPRGRERGPRSMVRGGSLPSYGPAPR